MTIGRSDAPRQDMRAVFQAGREREHNLRTLFADLLQDFGAAAWVDQPRHERPGRFGEMQGDGLRRGLHDRSVGRLGGNQRRVGESRSGANARHKNGGEDRRRQTQEKGSKSGHDPARILIDGAGNLRSSDEPPAGGISIQRSTPISHSCTTGTKIVAAATSCATFARNTNSS